MKDFIVSAYGRSNVGKKRGNNEDNFYLSGVTVDSANDITAKFNDSSKLATAVFDGMGGEAAGEKASQMAAVTFGENLSNIINSDFSEGAITSTIESANKKVCDEIRNMGKRMGCTFVSLGFSNNTIHIANVGDSRAYLLRDGKLYCISKDHTVSQTMVDSGVISYEESQKIKEKHMLTQHLGIFPDEMMLEPYFKTFAAKENDIVLLCSDGLTDMLSDSEIKSVLEQNLTPEETTNILVEKALENGGKDNVTVIVAKISEDKSFAIPLKTNEATDKTVNIVSAEEKTLKPRKQINKKLIIGIISAIVVLFSAGGFLGYNALLPRINATKDFENAVALVEEKNTELEAAISKSEKLIGKKQPLLDKSLVSALENAISDAKAVKVTDFEMPQKVEDIVSRTKEFNELDYTEAIAKLSDKHIAYEIDAKRYQLVNVPTEAYVIQCLQTISDITGISAVTEETDPMDNLNKPGWYVAHVYFSVSLIDQTEVYGDSLIDKGTEAGGSIEVYTCVEEAIKREKYLSGFDGSVLASGSHTVLGTCVVRTSDKLTATQQKDLEAKLIAALTYLKEVDGEKEFPKETESETTETTSIETTQNEQETKPTVSRKEQAVTMALNNLSDYTTPNDLKSILKSNGFSTDEIEYAVYGGHVNWQGYIPDFIENLSSEAEEITITRCTRCHKRFKGEYNSCQDEDCGGGVNWSYYQGYSRDDTISNLSSMGFSQTDINEVMQNYKYGKFIDEIDFD